MKQLQRYGLAGIMALALFLRCLGLNTRGIQYDDAFSILLAERSLPDIVRGTAADTMPPLYYSILHFWLQVSLGKVCIKPLFIHFRI
jgi:mannosyltransferase